MNDITIPELLKWLDKQVELWTEREYTYSDWHWTRKARRAGATANMYGEIHKKLSDAWENCNAGCGNAFEIRRAAKSVVSHVDNGDIGTCDYPNNMPAGDFDKFQKDLDDAWRALTDLGKAVQATPRNCDAYPPEELQKRFLREKWLVDSEGKDDPVESWTKEMLVSYAKWILEPCREEKKDG